MNSRAPPPALKAAECGSREVTLFAIESQAELDAVWRTLPQGRPPDGGADELPEARPAGGPALAWRCLIRRLALVFGHCVT